MTSRWTRGKLVVGVTRERSRAIRCTAERLRRGSLAALLLALAAGCSSQSATATIRQKPVTLTVAFGLSSGENPQSGARQAVVIVASESLVAFGRDGRAQPRLAESWSVSEDGKSLRIRLRAGATFHDGQPVTAAVVQDVLTKQLRARLGSGLDDIEDIRAISRLEFEILLKRRWNFILEALADAPIDLGQLQGGIPNGTGPFKIVQLSERGGEMAANDAYYGGRPSIDRVQIKPYSSVRAAWADMLRGQADMLYEVGPDAIDILEGAKSVRVVSHLRNYAYVVMLNVRRPALRDPSFRVFLNSAIDRHAVLTDALKGRGLAAEGAVWPSHWALDQDAPAFRYAPREVSARRASFNLMVADPAHERLALVLQQQLQRVGVDLKVQLLPLDQAMKRASEGDFDGFLVDVQLGPTLFQSYRTWRTGAPRNLGGFSSAKVDAALDRIDQSSDDSEYRAGVAALQRAIYDDPPAIFIAWSERARAVSTRFDVPIEPGRDILGTLRQWKPVADEILASRN